MFLNNGQQQYASHKQKHRKYQCFHNFLRQGFGLNHRSPQVKLAQHVSVQDLQYGKVSGLVGWFQWRRRLHAPAMVDGGDDDCGGRGGGSGNITQRVRPNPSPARGLMESAFVHN